MNLTTASIDLEDDQARIRNIELNEFIVQGGKFSYKSIKHVTSAIFMATMFLLSFLSSSFFGIYTLIYTRHLLSSLPYTCTADSLCWSLYYQPPLEVFRGSCKAERILFRDHFIINEARGLAAEHSMRW